jgi:hypothetical protein
MDGPEAGAARDRRLAWTVGIAVAVAVAVGVGLVVVLSSGGEHRRIPGAKPAPGAQQPAKPAPGAQQAAKPAPGAQQFGVSVNRLFNDGTYTPAQIDAQLAAVHATGATIARTDALWEASEPNAPAGGVHHYDWTFDDTIAAALARSGLRWLPIIDYTAPWAESVPGTDHSPPRSAADFAAYAAAFAARYGSGGSFWIAHPDLTQEPIETFEIWNEPDSPHFWIPTPDPVRYAGLYRSARDAILAVDPAARVIVGGLSNPGAFLPALLAAAPELRGHIDGVAIHPYAPGPGRVISTVARARTTLTSLGLASVPLYVTEFGWPTLPPHSQDWAPERLRPGYIERTIAALGHVNCSLAMTILYTWVTPEHDPADREDWFGISSPAGGDTPDVQALTAGLRLARSSGPQVQACKGEGAG